MGYYAECKDGRARDKAEGMVSDYDAKLVDKEEAYRALQGGKGVFIIVHNLAFEAAAYVFSEEEWEDFHDYNDKRPKDYVVMDKDTAERISGYKR